MSNRTWIYIVILIIVLAAGGVFFWWMYKTSKITPVAEVSPGPAAPTFADVPTTYWAYNQIEAVYQQGYMLGYRQFKPTDEADRATVAAALAKAYGLSASPATPSFADVPTTHWAYSEIEGLKAAGIIEGYQTGDGSDTTIFRPEELATRATVAVIAASSYAGSKAAVPDGPATPSFPDVPTDFWAYKYIEYCKANDIMHGFNEGANFQPDTIADRATVAVATARAVAKGDANVPTPSTVTFIDVASDFWAYKYIEYCYSIGAMVGYQPVFKPDDNADRATVAVAVARAHAGSDANVPTYENKTPSFPDVPATHWAFRYIEYCFENKLMIGFPNGTFQPEGVGDRATIAVALARAKGLTLDATTSSFVDVPTDYWAFMEIEAGFKACFFVGCKQDASGRYYCPDQTISGDAGKLSRASLAVFVYNAYISTNPCGAITPSYGPLTPTPKPTPTVAPSAPFSPTPRVSASVGTATPTPVASSTQVGQAGTGTGTGAGTTTGTAQTGPEIPLMGAGLLGALLLFRYAVGRKIK